MKNILIVNIKTRKSSIKDFVPLALLKLSTKHKQLGDNVNYVQSPCLPDKTPDIIYFSTIFIFEIKNEIETILGYQKKYPRAKIIIGGISATLKNNIFEKYIKNAEIKRGLCDELDDYTPDYDIAQKQYSYGYTSRGCINKCAWCVVPKIEGKLRKLSNWTKALHPMHKLFFAFDNNILACGYNHLKDVLSEIKKRNMKIEFNQAMDCVVFCKNEKIQQLMYDNKNLFHVFKFAWDNRRQDNYAKKTALILNNFTNNNSKKIWYVLSGNNDTPEEIFNRIKYLYENNNKIKLMRYKNLETGKYACPWIDFENIMNTGLSTIFVNGIISKSNTGEKYIDFTNFTNFKKCVYKLSKMKKYKLNTKIFDEIYNKI